MVKRTCEKEQPQTEESLRMSENDEKQRNKGKPPRSEGSVIIDPDVLRKKAADLLTEMKELLEMEQAKKKMRDEK